MEEPDWDLFLDNILLGIRVTPSRRTGLSPYEVMFGEAARLPTSMKFRAAKGDLPVNLERLPHVDFGRFVSDRAAEHQARWLRVRESLRRYQEGAAVGRFKPGDMLMVRNFTRKKAEPRWTGPFVVLKATPKGVEITTAEGNSRFLTLGDVKKWRPKDHDLTDLDAAQLIRSSPDQQLGGNYVEPATELVDQEDASGVGASPE